MKRPTPLELAVVAAEVFVLLLMAYSFWTRPNTALFERFSRDLGVLVTPRFFVVFSLVCVVVSIGALIPRQVFFKQYLYLVALSPLVLYMFPVGYFLLATGMSGFGVFVLLGFALPYALLAFAVWRPSDALPRR